MFYLKPSSLDAAYHFATEEFLLRHFDLAQPTVMLWQTEPTVMLGQYQIADAEIVFDSASAHAVKVVRRPSGGGAIYTDAGTLLISLILPEKYRASGALDTFPQKAAQNSFAELLTTTLEKLDIPAVSQGRNDILLEGKKISGMAQHVYRGRCCTHGSLLFDADLDRLSSLLRVDDEKFRSKAVKSIRSRVTNVKEYAQSSDLPIASLDTAEFVHTFTQALVEAHNAQSLELNCGDEAIIKHIYQEKYGNPDWAGKRTPPFSQHTRRRFDAGLLDVYLDIVKGLVIACSVHGDFLGSVPVTQLEQLLVGLPYSREKFTQALDEFAAKEVSVDALSPYLGGISAEEFLSCVFD